MCTILMEFIPLCFDKSIIILHDHPVYLVCPDVLSLVGEALAGDGCGSTNHI